MLYRVLMQCEYIGNFNKSHSTTKKRRMIGAASEKAISLILKDGISCESFREREAVRLMKEGINNNNLNYYIQEKIHI